MRSRRNWLLGIIVYKKKIQECFHRCEIFRQLLGISRKFIFDIISEHLGPFKILTIIILEMRILIKEVMDQQIFHGIYLCEKIFSAYKNERKRQNGCRCSILFFGTALELRLSNILAKKQQELSHQFRLNQILFSKNFNPIMFNFNF